MPFICQKLFVFRKFGANFHKIYVYRVYQNKKGAAVQRCSIKILFRNESQISQEDTCAGVTLLMNLQACSL